MEKTACLIIGGGPAGYTAAIYASRANLAPVLYEGAQPGGQLTTTTDIENYPGFENGINGQELMATMRAQAVRLGADIRFGTVSDVDFSSRPFKVKVDGTIEMEADAVIVATGRPLSTSACRRRRNIAEWVCRPALHVTASFIVRKLLPL